jgi:hypothetical protein
MPLPRAYTSVLAVPKSMAKSEEKTLNSERIPCEREERDENPFDDIVSVGFSLELSSSLYGQ